MDLRQNIVFAEGFGMHLILLCYLATGWAKLSEAKELNLDVIVNTRHLGNNLFKVGATIIGQRQVYPQRMVNKN
jgi:hypothetical protein